MRCHGQVDVPGNNFLDALGDAALDEVTERAAEALGVQPYEIRVRPTSHGRDGEGYCAYVDAKVKGIEYTGAFRTGPTRVAAVEALVAYAEALAARAKPKLKPISEMTIDELAHEVNNALPDGQVAQARKARTGCWRIFCTRDQFGFIDCVNGWHANQVDAWREAVRALRARDAKNTNDAPRED